MIKAFSSKPFYGCGQSGGLIILMIQEESRNASKIQKRTEGRSRQGKNSTLCMYFRVCRYSC